MASMDCATAMTMLAFGCICLTIMFIVVAHYVLKQSTNDEQIDGLHRSTFSMPVIQEGCPHCNNNPMQIHHISIQDCLRLLCIRYSRVSTSRIIQLILYF
jgi:hypothetical protein